MALPLLSRRSLLKLAGLGLVAPGLPAVDPGRPRRRPMTTLIGPFLLQLGQQTLLTLPGQQQGIYDKIAVYNLSSVELQVWDGAGTDLLEPLQANLYDCSASSSPIAVQPTVSGTAQTYVGTVRGVLYGPDEEPPGFPLSLQPFPGGAVLVGELGGGASGPTSITIAPPASTGALQIATPGGAALVDNYLTVTGVESGTEYYAGTPKASPVLVPLIGGSDTLYTIAVTLAVNPVISVYAQPALPTPTFPTTLARAGITAGGETVLPALSSGAYYLFWITTDNCSATEVNVNFDGATVVVPGNSAAGPPYDLAGVRVTTSVSWSGSGGAGAGNGTIAYAIGP